MKLTILTFCAALAVSTCGSAQPSNPQSKSEESSMQNGLVALEFSGSRQSLERVAAAASKLGWSAETKNGKLLRILPPQNYDPDLHFGPLLQRIEELGISNIGLRLIGPNGPVGPEG